MWKRTIAPLARAATGAVESLAVALFPPRCGACNTALMARPRDGLCETCYEVLELNAGVRCGCCDLPGEMTCSDCRARPPAFAGLRAPLIYGGPIADLVVAAKFSGREDLAEAMAWLVANDGDATRLAVGTQALVPVPLGRKRQRQRGYNQSAIIARRLGRIWRLPVRHLLRRQRDTLPQSDLALQRRPDNVRGAFVTRGTAFGKVALVDDVVTSGETVRQAASALRAGGADKVVVIAVARTALES